MIWTAPHHPQHKQWSCLLRVQAVAEFPQHCGSRYCGYEAFCEAMGPNKYREKQEQKCPIKSLSATGYRSVSCVGRTEARGSLWAGSQRQDKRRCSLKELVARELHQVASVHTRKCTKLCTDEMMTQHLCCKPARNCPSPDPEYSYTLQHTFLYSHFTCISPSKSYIPFHLYCQLLSHFTNK